MNKIKKSQTTEKVMKIITGNKSKMPPSPKKKATVKAVPETGISLDRGDDFSMNVRKIDNGFIISQSVWNRKAGQSHRKEYYSPKNPLA